VLAFLVRLLEDEGRQALFLDRLDRGNLYVFGRCLRTRARYGALVELGRASTDDFAPMWSRRSHVLTPYGWNGRPRRSA
jgi:hypothetical protein